MTALAEGQVRRLHGESGPRTQSQSDSGVTALVPRLFDVLHRVQAATRHRPDEMGSCEEGLLLLQQEQQPVVWMFLEGTRCHWECARVSRHRLSYRSLRCACWRAFYENRLVRVVVHAWLMVTLCTGMRPTKEFLRADTEATPDYDNPRL